MKDEKIKPSHKAVMLIDDNSIDNFVNEKIIKTIGFASTVYVNTSVLSSLEFLNNMEKIKKYSPGMVPEIIFLDLNLPMLDGFQFLDEFEKFSAEFKSKIKIIILTSSINPNDVERSKGYESVVDYCYKPLTVKELSNFLICDVQKMS